MTKEEIIKQAWGEKLNLYKPNSEGWSSKIVYEFNDFDFNGFDTKIVGHGMYKIRPESLKGIENNNGWIKIESEEDLPKESIEYWVVLESGTITKASYLDGRKVFFMFGDLKVTHYKKLDYPQPPIY